MKTAEERNTRILIIDDNEAIHSDFAKILASHNKANDELDSLESNLFDDDTSPDAERQVFDLESAIQGKEGFEKVIEAVEEGKPFAFAFVDMRMPPGWDGLETIQHLWSADSDLLVVICTAYSDYTWEDLQQRLERADQLMLLKKPFGNIEVQRLAADLTKKWNRIQEANEFTTDNPIGHEGGA